MKLVLDVYNAENKQDKRFLVLNIVRLLGCYLIFF